MWRGQAQGGGGGVIFGGKCKDVAYGLGLRAFAPLTALGLPLPLPLRLLLLLLLLLLCYQSRFAS